jgi:hypothetical protein
MSDSRLRTLSKLFTEWAPPPPDAFAEPAQVIVVLSLFTKWHMRCY